MKYESCRKADLAKFAQDRGITVPSTSLSLFKGPLVRDFVSALKQADRDATFRFLDLPPEVSEIHGDKVLLMWKCTDRR